MGPLVSRVVCQARIGFSHRCMVRASRARLAAAETDGDDLEQFEAEFVKVAAAYGDWKGVTYEAWRAGGVPRAVLKGRRDPSRPVGPLRPHLTLDPKETVESGMPRFSALGVGVDLGGFEGSHWVRTR